MQIAKQIRPTCSLGVQVRLFKYWIYRLWLLCTVVQVVLGRCKVSISDSCSGRVNVNPGDTCELEMNDVPYGTTQCDIVFEAAQTYSSLWYMITEFDMPSPDVDIRLEVSQNSIAYVNRRLFNHRSSPEYQKQKADRYIRVTVSRKNNYRDRVPYFKVYFEISADGRKVVIGSGSQASSGIVSNGQKTILKDIPDYVTVLLIIACAMIFIVPALRSGIRYLKRRRSARRPSYRQGASNDLENNELVRHSLMQEPRDTASEQPPQVNLATAESSHLPGDRHSVSLTNGNALVFQNRTDRERRTVDSRHVNHSGAPVLSNSVPATNGVSTPDENRLDVELPPPYAACIAQPPPTYSEFLASQNNDATGIS